MRLDTVRYISKNKVFTYKFDFEIGYLIKSPCKECEREKFPDCSNDCNIIDKIQTILTESISCTRRI